MWSLRSAMLLFCPAVAAAGADWSLLTDFAEDVRECYGMVGLSVAVTDAEAPLYAQGFGMADQEAGVPVDASTRFSIASTTKSVTTGVLALLMEQGQLPRGWKTKVRDVIAGFALNSTIGTQLATLEDLLAHKTGVPRNDFPWQTGAALSVQRDALVDRVRWFPEELEMREGYLYNNWMYLVAGHVAESVSGSSWEHLAQSLIFGPLGMDSTGTSVEEAIASGHYAVPYGQPGYGEASEALPLHVCGNMEAVGPMGSMVSTPSDMTRWIRVHLNQGAPLMPASRWAELHTPQNAMNSNPSTVQPYWPVESTSWDYGVGWRIGTYRGYRRDSHGGRAMGHRASMSVYPDAGVGIFSSCSGGRWHDKTVLGMDLIDHFAFDLTQGITPWLNSSYACSLAPPSQSHPTAHTTSAASPSSSAVAALSCAKLRALEGMYSHPGYGDVHVEATGRCGRTPGKFDGANITGQVGAEQAVLTLTYGDLTVLLEPEAQEGAYLARFQRPLLLYFAWRGNAQPALGTLFRDDTVLLPWLEEATPPLFVKS